MKECRKCGAAKPLSEFHKNKRHPDGVHPRCKECRCAEQRDYNAANQEKIRVYRQANRDRMNENRRDWYRRLKREVLEAYGGKCACCGETEEAFLVFDHVNDDGAEHRKEVKAGASLLWWASRNGYPPILQILCANCNTAKHFAPGGCPHQRAEGHALVSRHLSIARSSGRA